MSEPKKGDTSSTTINVRLRNLFLVILAAFCTFGGPYLVYLLAHLLKADIIVSVACGFTLFFFGLGLIVVMVWKKIIT